MITHLRIPADSGFFTKLLSIPIDQHGDHSLALKGTDLPKIRSHSKLLLSANDIILASLRYLYVVGQDENAVIQAVNGWVDTLRWHLATFWEIDHAKNCIYPKAHSPRATKFAGDHAKFSGEMLAQGFAVKTLELAGYGQNSLFFFPSGREATPDFVVLGDGEQAETAIIARDGKRIALEARCRKYPQSFKRGEKARLKEKKHGFAQVLAVYFQHAQPYVKKFKTRRPERTRIIVADPLGDEKPQGDAFRYTVAVRHYLLVARQIGLWVEAEILEHRLLQLRSKMTSFEKREPTYRDRPGIIRREFGGRTYYGRDFNDTLRLMRTLSSRELLHIKATNDFGDVRYYGLDDDVLQAIVSGDLERLAAATPVKEVVEGVSLGFDGSILINRPPDQSEIQYFIKQIENVISDRVDRESRRSM